MPLSAARAAVRLTGSGDIKVRNQPIELGFTISSYAGKF
jgi:hypothetical protein